MDGQVIGNYKILEKLGEGGMGEVFKGLDMMLEREVAIKSLRPELSNREDIVGRFRSEAVALGRLNHPNIAMVHNFLLHENQYYMILEFVRGETLDKILARRRRLPWEEAVPILCQCLDGLEHAHRLGVVHRDIKPSNIIITPSGSVKLMDFGIARILQRARLTRAGHMVGTLEYMSPEHIQGLDADARTDIYSLGVVGYEMLTGRPPFQRNTDYELIKAQIEEAPIEMRQLQPDVPEPIASSLATAMEKSADKRHQTATAFLVSLEEALKSCSASGAPRTRSLRTSPETRLVEDPLQAMGDPAATRLSTAAPTYQYGQEDSSGSAERKGISSAFGAIQSLPALARYGLIAVALALVCGAVYFMGPFGGPSTTEPSNQASDAAGHPAATSDNAASKEAPVATTTGDMQGSSDFERWKDEKINRSDMKSLEDAFRLGSANAYTMKMQTSKLPILEEYVADLRRDPNSNPAAVQKAEGNIAKIREAVDKNMESYGRELQTLHDKYAISPELVKSAFDSVIKAQESGGEVDRVELTKLMWSHIERYGQIDEATWKSELVKQGK